MNFCDCKNLLTPIITAEDAYFKCSVCDKRHPFKEGDTLIKPPAERPSGLDKVAHIVRYMARKNIFATVDDRPCPKCKNQYAKVLIDTETWYACMKCEQVYQ